jgi:RraA family protein
LTRTSLRAKIIVSWIQLFIIQFICIEKEKGGDFLMQEKFGFRVIENITRPNPKLLEQLRSFTAPELSDGAPIYNAMDFHIKPMVTTQKIVGPAVTLRLTLGDSLLVTKAIAVAKPGDILVIDGRGSGNNALWGDHRSQVAKIRGLAGVVIDGAFRDIENNERIGFPIYARAVTCGTSTKNWNGEINVGISCGGVVVEPGDVIVGDRNGVVVVPLRFAEQIIAGAREKLDKMRRLEKEVEETGKVIPDNYAAQLVKLGY